MFSKPIKFELPVPWSKKTFETQNIGFINFLVGPNGSGKSKFSQMLLKSLPKARLLGTDRQHDAGRGPAGPPFDVVLKPGLRSWGTPRRALPAPGPERGLLPRSHPCHLAID